MLAFDNLITQISQREICNGEHTNRTCFNSWAISNVHGNKLILWSLLQITTTHTLAIREYYTILASTCD